MFDRRLFSSPSKNARKLKIIVVTNGHPPEYSQRQLPGTTEEKEADEFKLAQLSTLNIDKIKPLLETSFTRMDSLTKNYLHHIKPVVGEILRNWPISILEKLATTEKHPLVSLSITVATKEFIFDCQTLHDKAKPYFTKWAELPAKQLAFRKLHHATSIYYCLHEPDKLCVSKLLDVKSYLEKPGVSREMRQPRTANVQPSATHGAQYLKGIIIINDNCCVEIENLCTHSDLATLNRQTIIRLEWICLHYINFLADKIHQQLNQLPPEQLTELHQRSANIQDDNRFMLVTRDNTEQFPREYKIHCSTLLSALHYFPSSEHYYFLRSSTALELLVHIEEVNIAKSDSEKLKSFFELIGSDHFQKNISKKSSCNWRFWQGDFSSTATVDLLANINKIKAYHEREIKKFPEEKVDSSLLVRRFQQG